MSNQTFRAAHRDLGSKEDVEAFLRRRYPNADVAGDVARFRRMKSSEAAGQQQPQQAPESGLEADIRKLKTCLAALAKIYERLLPAIEKIERFQERHSRPSAGTLALPQDLLRQACDDLSRDTWLPLVLGVPFALVMARPRKREFEAMRRVHDALGQWSAPKVRKSRAAARTDSTEHQIRVAVFIDSASSSEPKYLAAVQCLATGRFQSRQRDAANLVGSWQNVVERTKWLRRALAGLDSRQAR